MRIKLFLLIILFLSAGLFSLHSGSVNISWANIFHYFSGQAISAQDSFLIQSLRLPRTLASLLIGGCLAVAGLVLQTILRNPLAEPYTLGLSGGSSLGAVAALVLVLEPGPRLITGIEEICKIIHDL